MRSLHGVMNNFAEQLKNITEQLKHTESSGGNNCLISSQLVDLPSDEPQDQLVSESDQVSSPAEQILNTTVDTFHPANEQTFPSRSPIQGMRELGLSQGRTYIV
jgi:hypothetical protein